MTVSLPKHTQASTLLFFLLLAVPVAGFALESFTWTASNRQPGTTRRTSRRSRGYRRMTTSATQKDDVVRHRRRPGDKGGRMENQQHRHGAVGMTVESDDKHDKPLKKFPATYQSLSSWWSEQRHRSVFGVLSASFLSLLGFTMVAGPLTPALGKHFGLQIGGWFGSLTSAYPLGMFLGILLWPSMSDRVGRRPILTISLLGSGLGLLTQSLVVSRGGSLTQFLLARALTGLFAGSSPVSKAYLADIGTKDGKLPRYLALKDASATMAFILGPAAGGILFDIRRRMVGAAAENLSKEDILLNTSGSLAFVIAVSAVASLLASALAGVLVRESDVLKTIKPLNGVTTADSTKSSTKHGAKEALTSSPDTSTPQAQQQLISCPLGRSLWAGVASVCLVSFLFNVGDSTFHAFYSAFLKDQGVTVRDIGLLYTSMACISFAVSSTSASAILKSLGPVLACVTGLSMVGSGLLLLGAIASGTIALIQPTFAVSAVAAGIYFCGVPIYGPTVSTMLLQCVPPNRRGFILGLDGSINTLARVVSPLAMGALYRKYNAGIAFGVAGIAVMSGVGTALFRRYIVMKEQIPSPSATTTKR